MFFIEGARLSGEQMKAQRLIARLKVHDSNEDNPGLTECGRRVTEAILMSERAGEDVTCDACLNVQRSGKYSREYWDWA